MSASFMFSGYFNPRPPWGGRPSVAFSAFSPNHFNPRPPWGGRLKSLDLDDDKMAFQSTPSVGRATCMHPPKRHAQVISIHALRGEGDTANRPKLLQQIYFNPRPPWGGRRPTSSQQKRRKYFNPRPPWGGRRARHGLGLYIYAGISIHALRGEGDTKLT